MKPTAVEPLITVTSVLLPAYIGLLSPVATDCTPTATVRVPRAWAGRTDRSGIVSVGPGALVGIVQAVAVEVDPRADRGCAVAGC